MRTGIIATLITIACAASLHAEDAKQFFDSIYGSRVKQVKATVDRADDFALAKEILAAAQSLERADAVGLMCDCAIDLSQRHPDGFSTAIDALRVIEAKIEPRRAEARKKLVELLTRQSATGSAEARQQAADELIDLLVSQGDEAAEAKQYDDAFANYRQALAAAQRVKSAEIDAVKAKMEWAGNRGRMEKQIARLREKLLADANDAASADEIVRLYIVELDDPAEAMKHIERAKDAKLKKMVPLAAQSASDADALALGEWYVELANAASAAGKEGMWRQASGHLTRYLASQPSDELARTKADLLLKSVIASLEPLETEPGRGAAKSSPATWISKDATYRASSEFGSFKPLPDLLTGGRSLHENTFAFHTAPEKAQFIVIDLGKPMLVERVWIENRRLEVMQPRATGLRMFLSTKTSEKGRLSWTAEKAEKEWTIQFPRNVKTRYITIQQAETSKESLHLAQVKVFGWDEKPPAAPAIRYLPLDQLKKAFSGLEKFSVTNGVVKGRASNSDIPGLPELKAPIEGKTFRFGLKMKAPSHQIIFGRANGQVYYYSRGVGANDASRVMGNNKGPIKLEGTVENPKEFALLEVEYDGRKVHYYYNGKVQYSDDIWDPTGEKKSFSFGFSSHLNDIEVKDVYLLIDGQSVFKK